MEENVTKKKMRAKRKTVRTGIVYIFYTDLSKTPLTFFPFRNTENLNF